MNDKKQVKTRERRKSSLDLGTMVYGKIPPQAVDIEETLLGSIMVARDAFDQVAELLTAECFYRESSQHIFRAMVELKKVNSPIDILTVTEQLRKMEKLEICGGAYHVTRITNLVVSDANNLYYCRIVLEKFMLRELIRISGQAISDAYEDGTDVFDVLDDFEKNFTELTVRRLAKKAVGIDMHLVERFNRVVELSKLPQHLTGITSGYPSLDRVTHGWQNTDLIILAARPAVGKTAFALNLARNASMDPNKKVPVALFSLEMSAGQLVDRMMSAESEVWLERFNSGNLEESHLRQIYSRAVQPLGGKAKIYIDDSPALNIYELRAACRRLKRMWKKELGTDDGLIIIDYLQLMSGTNDDSKMREREVASISRGLKGLAKELHVPIIALSQLNRDVDDKKGDKTPKLSHLRESGAIEQDADMVMFMYRPEYYDITANEMGEDNRGLTYLSIAKHRNGTLAQGNDAIKFRANLAIQKFTEWTDSPFTPARAGLPAGNWRPIKDFQDKDELPFE